MKGIFNKAAHSEISILNWLLLLILLLLPVVNILMLLVLAFSGKVNVQIANWSKAILLIVALIACIQIIYLLIMFVI